MQRLTSWLQPAALMLAGVVACAAAGPQDNWPLLDFKAFTLRAPADWVSTPGGIDSLAGRITGARVQFEYDFGRYSDPLSAPWGGIDLQTQATTIDGLPARWVRYTLPGAAGKATRFCLGLHVPEVRSSPDGRIRFTGLACSEQATALADAQAVLASVRFPRPVSR